MNTNGSVYDRIIEQSIPVLLGETIMYIDSYEARESEDGTFDAGNTVQLQIDLLEAGTDTVEYIIVQIT